MAGLFYKLLYNGLLICAAIISLIIGLIIYRKMWLGGKSFADLGTEGNAVIFMGLLVAASCFMAWRIKRARDKLE